MNKLFQTQCLYKEMTHSKDATFRAGDKRIPVEGTLQFRWADNMATIKPETNRPVVTPFKGVADHPHNSDASPFYMTGGTKRTHFQE